MTSGSSNYAFYESVMFHSDPCCEKGKQKNTPLAKCWKDSTVSLSVNCLRLSRFLFSFLFLTLSVCGYWRYVKLYLDLPLFSSFALLILCV